VDDAMMHSAAALVQQRVREHACAGVMRTWQEM
jgi:hypothetical protein